MKNIFQPVKSYAMLLVFQFFALITYPQQLAKKAIDGPANPKPYVDNSQGEFLVQPSGYKVVEASSPNWDQQARNPLIPENPSSIAQLWIQLQAIDQHLNTLLIHPKNDVLYNKTKQMLIEALNAQTQLFLNTSNSSELKKLENFEFELDRKASEVDRLRGLPSPAQNGSFQDDKDLQVEQFSAGLSEAFELNTTRTNALNHQLNDLEAKKEQEADELKETQKSVFATLLQKEKHKTAEPSFTPKPGLGFSRILFDDANVTLTYTLTLVERKVCRYKHVPFTSVVEGKVVSHEEYIPFAAYYYKATYELVNKKNLKLGIKGSILGSPTAFAQEHIVPFGEVGQCLGFHIRDTYWDKFYYAWDFQLTQETISATSHFWTEYPDEEPSWTINYSILP